MSRQHAIAIVGLGLLLGSTGCISCGHEACPKAIAAGPYLDTPLGDRRHVYTFLINGFTPSTALEDLRCKLAERGFEKTYRGELCHAWWFWSEMKRLHKCDPEAKFVLVGYGFGCSPVAGMAQDAQAAGLPVDAVVFIDPAGVKDMRGVAERTLIIRAGYDGGGDTGCLRVAGCGHFSLPTCEKTVEAIAVVLTETAARVVHQPAAEEGIIWPSDAPPPRDFTLPPGVSDEWHFLHDRFGPHAVPLEPLR
jgi:hypothetical protein